jgi:hypothetical protein
MNLNNMKNILFYLICFLPIVIFGQGKFVIGSNTQIVGTSNPIINLYNTDLYNNTGTNNFGIGTIWGFTGNIPQTIYGTYISSLYGLRLNNSNGFTIQSNTTISNRLDMVSGDINLSSYDLEVGTSTTTTGEINWTSGTIIGPLKRWFAPSTNLTQSSGIFPIGNNYTNRNVIINYTQAPTDGGYIIVEYKNGIPSMSDNYSGLPLWTSDGQLIQNYENQGYFDITPFDYNSSLNTKQYTLTMRANQLVDMNDRSIVRLIKSPGPTHTTWVSCGSHSSINGSSDSDFTITSTNVTGFSWFNFGSQNDNPLPVELLYFEAAPYQQWNVIKWSTDSEQNSSHFDLESSIDGENWRKITTIPSAGNSTEELKYSYIDYNLNSVTYYRLQQFDIDGKSKTYGPILVTKTITEKKIIKCINLMGQEVNPENTTGVVIEIYDDGTIRKMIR